MLFFCIFDKGFPPNFNGKCSILHCLRNAPTLFPRWGNNRAAAPPLGSPFGGAGERSETERAFAVANLHIGAVIERIPGGNHGAFFIFATACALSVTAFSRASSPIGRAKGRASPPSTPKSLPWNAKTGTRPSWVMSRFCVAFCRRVWYAYKRYYQYPGKRFP